MTIKTEFLKNDFNEYELAVVCYISTFSSATKTTYLISESVVNSLTSQTICPKCVLKNIEDAIQSLVSKGYLSVIKRGKSGVLVDITKCQKESTDFFFVVKPEEVNTILNLETRNRFSILKTFCTIISSINHSLELELSDGTYKKSFVCTLPVSSLSTLANCSERTFLLHVKALEDAKLLYVYRDHVKKDEGGNLSRCNNVYGRYVDKDYILSYAAKTRGYVTDQKQVQASKEKQSESMKTMWQKKKGYDTSNLPSFIKDAMADGETDPADMELWDEAEAMKYVLDGCPPIPEGLKIKVAMDLQMCNGKFPTLQEYADEENRRVQEEKDREERCAILDEMSKENERRRKEEEKNRPAPPPFPDFDVPSSVNNEPAISEEQASINRQNLNSMIDDLCDFCSI